MNVITTGSVVSIFSDDDAIITKDIPVGYYDVCFTKARGAFLQKREPIVIKEKIYGAAPIKAKKAINAYKNTNRSLGVILSGDKGIGKSISLGLVAQEAINIGLPVLVCNENIPGLVSFLSSITQEVLVVFDEFEKNFKDFNDPDEDETGPSAQEGLLSMFDGIDSTKKLFLITINSIYKLSSYMLNRPGRFHYHFKLKNPSPKEIEEYMRDNLDNCTDEIISRIIKFSAVADVTYDWLRAIAFELNLGSTLEEAIEDLNISASTTKEFILEMTINGFRYNANPYINFSEEYVLVNPRCDYKPAGEKYIQVRIPVSGIIIEGNNISVKRDCVEMIDDRANEWVKVIPEEIILEPFIKNTNILF